MKLSDLRLDAVYADNDGRPLMVLSLDKVIKPKRYYGAGTIRDVTAHDKSFGVVAIRVAYASRSIPVEALEAEARKYRATRPEKEMVRGDFEIFVSPLRLIVDHWDDHLIKMQAQSDRQQAAIRLAAEKTAERQRLVDRIKPLLPEGVRPQNLDQHHDYAQIRLTDLLAILERSVPTKR